MRRALSLLLVAACSSSGTDAPRPTGAAESPPAAAAPSASPVAADAPSAGEPAAPPEPAEPPAPAKPPRADRVELAFVGDVIFGRYRASGFDPIPEGEHEVFADISKQLEADVLIGNLETPLVRELPEGSPIGSKYRFGASLEMARHLVKGGFTAMSLANNHWFDQRAEGVEQTPRLLEEIGVVPIGAAQAEPPVFRVVTIEKKGWKFGFISITTRTNSPVRDDVPKPPYLSTYDVVSTLTPLLTEARASHDLLGVLVHWGDEYEDAPNLAQRKAARALIEAGADMVIGHHPHVLQGFERHQSGVIAYSLGNFLFENTNDPPRLTGVLRLAYEGQSRCPSDVVFHPAYIKRMPVQHPVPATGFMGRKVKDRVTRLGKRFGSKWEAQDDDLVLAAPACPE